MDYTVMKRLSRNIATTLLLSMLAVSVGAQRFQASLSHYSADDGLCSNTISKIEQDDYGYIWIATWNGLSRFDGYNFYNYMTGNASHIPGLHNRIMDMVIDNWQNVWMRMYDGHIFVVDRRKDKIVNPLENVSGSQDLRTSYPLVVTNNGDVLASMDGVGVYKMRLDQNNPANNEPQLITSNGLNVTCMAEGYHNDIWVGTDKGVHRLDINNLVVERKSYFPDEKVNNLYSNGYNIYVGTESGKILTFSYGQPPTFITQAPTSISALYVDSYGIIWYSDVENGVCRYKPASNDTKRFLHNVPAPEYDSFGATIHESMGTVWIILNHGGYGYYNRETDEFEYFHNDPINPWNLSNTVLAACELEEGVVWESTNRHGLEKLEILKNVITKSMLVPESDSPLDNEVRAMFYDKKRKLLFLGNKNNTMFVIRPDGSRTAITHDSKGNPIGRPYGFTQDSKGNYWLCSKDHGVFHIKPLDNGGFDIKNYHHDDNDEYSISSDAAYQAVEDRQGNIWVATYGGGVNILVPDKQRGYKAYHSKNVMRRYPRNTFKKIRTVALDSDGNVWAGSTDGILILSLRNNNISVKKLENSELKPDNILYSTDIVTLVTDNMGSMWVGTNGGGLSHAIGKDRKGIWYFETFTMKDGLSSDEIKSIAIDHRNNVWLATDHVLSSFDTQKKIFTTFGSLEGVDETICSEGAAVALPDDIVLIGTLHGYYTVDRKKLSTGNGSMLKLRITDFYLNGELLSPRFNNTYDYYIPEAKSVTMPTHDNVISVRFASLNYQLQHRVHYQYLLEGYDQQWQTADKTRTITYNALPTGTYRLKVKAFLLESPDNYDQRELEIVVPPYFMLSKNAIWIYMFLVGAISLLLMYMRQRHLMHRENLRQLKLAGEKTFKNEEDRKFIEQLNEWLEQHYTNPQLKTDEMVTLTNMSRSSFHNRLNDITGQTPEQYLGDFRLKKAILLLEQTNRTIVEIAQMTGFGNALNITRTFRQRMGMTPDHYRSQHAQMMNGTIPMATPMPGTVMPGYAPAEAAAAPATDIEDMATVDGSDDVTDDYEIIED